jgi:predicted nucleic acid-binding protein
LVLPRRKKPRPYVDTNVILDYIRKRNTQSIVLLETLKRRKIRFYISYYTVLELIDKEQENTWIETRIRRGESFDDIVRHRYPRDLDEAALRDSFKRIGERFVLPFIQTDSVSVMVPDNKSWDKTLGLLARTNLSVGDAIHVDAALGSDCNIFISNDDNLVKMLNESELILATNPSELETTLAEHGMRKVV